MTVHPRPNGSQGLGIFHSMVIKRLPAPNFHALLNFPFFSQSWSLEGVQACLRFSGQMVKPPQIKPSSGICPVKTTKSFHASNLQPKRAARIRNGEPQDLCRIPYPLAGSYLHYLRVSRNHSTVVVEFSPETRWVSSMNSQPIIQVMTSFSTDKTLNTFGRRRRNDLD